MEVDTDQDAITAPMMIAERLLSPPKRSLADIFGGCAPKRPLDYSGSAGLIWAINGGRLVEVHRDWAVIDVPLQTRQRIFSRRNGDPAKIHFALVPAGWLERAARSACAVGVSQSRPSPEAIGAAERAAKLGWDAMALFGCAPKRPLDYLGSAGLLWAINGGKLLELHRDWAMIDVPLHSSQRIFSRRNVDARKIKIPP